MIRRTAGLLIVCLVENAYVKWISIRNAGALWSSCLWHNIWSELSICGQRLSRFDPFRRVVFGMFARPMWRSNWSEDVFVFTYMYATCAMFFFSNLFLVFVFNEYLLWLMVDSYNTRPFEYTAPQLKLSFLPIYRLFGNVNGMSVPLLIITVIGFAIRIRK